jgi:serine protease inhibitor
MRGARLMGMGKTVRVTAGLVAAGLLVAGCGTATRGGPQPPGAIRGVVFREPAVSPRPYGAADTAFGMDVLGAWCKADPHANLVLSPASLATGLGMAYLGARGATARDMAAVLHLPAAAGQRLEAGLQARSAALRGLSRPGVTVASSDQIWADPGLVTRASYLNAVATGYRAGVARVPLQHDPAKAAQQIDQTIAAATRGHIPQLLTPAAVQQLGWVLTDALYLNAAWATPFQPAGTKPGSFRTAAGSQVQAHFMSGGQFRRAETAGWTAVALPYRGRRLAMVALLPPAAGGGGCSLPPAATLGTMTGALANGSTAARGAAGTSWATIGLPKISLSTKASLETLLTGLGMGVAFTSAADFSGLSPQACCIGLVEHAATLQVGEKGTVASAATAVGMEPSSAMAPPQVVFDRPYLLLVTDTGTGEPLFLARVADPAAS